MSIDNQAIRQLINQQRKQHPKEENALNSESIAQRTVEALSGVALANSHLALYKSLAQEVNLTPLEARLRSAGARIHFPRVKDRQAKLLEFVEVGANMSSHWQSGPYGIEEPHPELRPIDPKILDIVFIPGVAFGPNGERVGMGGGYYDRALPSLPNALRIALAFDFQLLPELKQNPWDQPVHWVITEKREVRTAFADEWLRKHRNG